MPPPEGAPDARRGGGYTGRDRGRVSARLERGPDYAGLERGLRLAGLDPVSPPFGRRFLRRLRARPATLVGLLLLAGLGLLILLGPALAPHDPAAVHPDHRLAGPGGLYPLGTDELGRCLLSRLLHGARWSLGPAAVAMAAVLFVGLLVGGVAGYAGGVVDTMLMRLVDVLLAFPALVPAIAIVGMLGPGTWQLTLAIAAVWWAAYARVVRGMVLAFRERPHVEAARALGFGPARILRRHVLPGVLPPVLVLASVDAGAVILTMTALSFLGLGVQPPTPEWGAMLADARAFLLTAPQLMMWPGLAICIAVVTCNLVGEGLRDLTDPRMARR